MRKSLALLKRFAREENGASMVEYGVLVALIAAVSIVAITLLGTQIDGAFDTVTSALTTAGITPTP